MAKSKKNSASKASQRPQKETSKSVSSPSSKSGKQSSSTMHKPVASSEATDISAVQSIDSVTGSTVANTYDQVPYPSHPYSASHPDRMYSMARVFGVAAPLPEQARILELGCAAGGNLIPIAVQLPKAQLVGVDLSTKQIAEGQAAIASLKLKNIRLIQADISSLPNDLGHFDYIVCHGVFSWVPPALQQQILKICGQLLSANGIAYISYNTLPGWHMRSMIRGMMLKHAGGIADPNQKIEQSRALLQFLTESTAQEQTPFARFLRDETELLSKQSDQYLFHEHLEDQNNPMYFQDFMSLAYSSGLQFLGESSLSSMWIGNLPAKAVETLEKLTQDVVMRGQYADFVRNRTFRQTLLCRQRVEINRAISPERLADVRVLGKLQQPSPAQGLELSDASECVFQSSAGHRITSRDPVYKTMLAVISDHFPRSLGVAEICRLVQERLSLRLSTAPGALQIQPELIARNLIQLLLTGVLDFRYLPDRFQAQPGSKPQVSAWARWQAERGNQVTNLRHEMLTVCDVTRAIIPLIDGKRSPASLSEEMLKLVDAGRLKLQASTELNKNQKLQFLQQMSEKILDQMARSALLA